jgi:L-asparaginase
MNPKPKTMLTVLMFGGTIAMQSDGGPGVTPTMTGEALVAALGPAAAPFDLSVETVRLAPSANLGLADVRAMLERIEAAKAAGRQGVVIALGTDTLEEVAFALDLLAPDGVAVVLTGAMRNPTLPGADGIANLLAALQVAATPFAQGCGPVVVINDEIHAARFVRKAHPFSLGAFTSSPLGPIGWISEGRPRRLTNPVRSPALRLADGPLKRVALLTTWLGDDGALLSAAIEAGFDGLVIEGFGAGHLPEALAPIAGAAAQAMPVVLASSTGPGETGRRTSGFVGGEIDHIGRGQIPAGTLSGRKARLYLSLLLQAGADIDAVRAAFAAL